MKLFAKMGTGVPDWKLCLDLVLRSSTARQRWGAAQFLASSALGEAWNGRSPPSV